MYYLLLFLLLGIIARLTRWTTKVTHMSLVPRKPVFGVSDQVPHKPGCTATEDGYRLEISDLGRRGILLSM